MKAVGLYKYLPVDDPESLVDVEVPKPEAKGRDLLVRVKAVSGVGRQDGARRMGNWGHRLKETSAARGRDTYSPIASRL